MTTEDEAAIVGLFQAEDLAHRGYTDFTLEDLRERILDNSQFDGERDLALMQEDGRLIAVASCVGRGSRIVVAPDRDEPGLRRELLAWTERRQVERGHDTFRVSTFAGHADAVAVLRGSGYELERTYALMVRTFAQSGPPAAPELAEGYAIRPIDAGADVIALHEVYERAFAERPDRVTRTPEEFQRSLLGLTQYEPAWSFIAHDDGGEPVGLIIGWRPPGHPHGHVPLLGVDPDHRGRGLGRALLLSALAVIHDHGLATAELHVASDNPSALGLYTGVGMVERERFDHFARPA